MWRCRERGYKNLYSLEGGVARYLKEEGPALWKGHLFVFDSRLAVPPRDYAAEAAGSGGAGPPQAGAGEEPIVRCSLCAGELDHVRHRNCANAACNALILCVFPRLSRIPASRRGSYGVLHRVGEQGFCSFASALADALCHLTVPGLLPVWALEPPCAH